MELLRGGAKRVSLLLAMLAAILATGKPALAAKHAVGGKEGWDVSTDLSTWASSQTLRVGDELVFKYTPGLHSVVELPGEREYKSCDMGGAVDSMNGGTSTVKLDRAGYRYFTCGTAGHCGEGMKVKIRTLGAKEAASQDSPSSSTTSASSSWSQVPSLLLAVSSAILGFIML
uniref:Blue copper protein n=1 Tax=Anthurium amnicola TaxID=1678845 RepID=A0A1D1Z367_9ARAE